MTAAEKIRTAPNAAAINAILDSGEAMVRMGPKSSHWAFTVCGTIIADGTFDTARRAAAAYQEA